MVASASLSPISPAPAIRDDIRNARHTTMTAGLTPGYLQANLVIRE